MIEVKDKYTARLLAGEGEFKLFPYHSYTFNSSTQSKVVLDSLYETDDYTSPYDRKDYIFTWENCIDLFFSNQGVLSDFYDSIKNDINFICEETKKIKVKK